MFFCSSNENCNGSHNGGVIMRTENKMYDLILDIAKNDVRMKTMYWKLGIKTAKLY